MKRLCGYAGVEPSKVFPHNFRHLFATAFYKAYKDIVRLADVLGHSSIETTRIYLVTSGEEHVRQLERLGLVSSSKSTFRPAGIKPGILSESTKSTFCLHIWQNNSLASGM